jgi:hypothetical protein
MVRISFTRSLGVLTLLTAGCVAAVSCGDHAPAAPAAPSLATGDDSRVSPSATAPETITAASASSGATPQRFSVDLTVPAFPTCPLTPPAVGEITGTGVLTIITRSVTASSGGTHFSTTIVGHGKATDELGGNWQWTDADLNNEVIPGTGNTSSHSFSQTVREGFHVIGPGGQKVMVMGTFHVTMVNGATVVEFEKGNHEDGEVCESGFVLTPLP